MIKRINLALQDGGAHGAYTWGVLDRLLDEGMARGRGDLRLSKPRTPSGLA